MSTYESQINMDTPLLVFVGEELFEVGGITGVVGEELSEVGGVTVVVGEEGTKVES